MVKMRGMFDEQGVDVFCLGSEEVKVAFPLGTKVDVNDTLSSIHRLNIGQLVTFNLLLRIGLPKQGF